MRFVAADSEMSLPLLLLRYLAVLLLILKLLLCGNNNDAGNRATGTSSVATYERDHRSIATGGTAGTLVAFLGLGHLCQEESNVDVMSTRFLPPPYVRAEDRS